MNDAERARARALAKELGVSENRLYSEIIHDGLLMCEQMAYLGKLRAMAVSAREELEILKQAPDAEPNVRNRL